MAFNPNHRLAYFDTADGDRFPTQPRARIENLTDVLLSDAAVVDTVVVGVDSADPRLPDQVVESQWPAAVARRYVTATGSDTNDGLTWGSSFLTVQAAIASLPVNGGTVEIGPGNFTTALIAPVDDLVLTGQGPGITTLTAVAVILGAVVDGTSVDNVTIKNMTLDGNSAGQSVAGGRACIRFITSTRIRLSNVECTDAKQDGVYLSGCDDIKGDVWVHDNLRNGVSHGDSNGVTTNSRLRIKSSGHTTAGAIGVSLEPAQYAQIEIESSNDYNPVVIGGGTTDDSSDNTVIATISAPTNTGTTIITGTSGAFRNNVIVTGDTTRSMTGTASKSSSRNRIITALAENDAVGSAPSLDVATASYWSYPATHSTLVTIAGVLYLHPVYIPRDLTLDRIGCEVTAVGGAGSTISQVIYDSNITTGRPQNLVINVGTAVGTVDGNTVAVVEQTISQALVGGRKYWFGMLVLGGTPTVRSFTSPSWSGEQGSLANALGTGSFRPGRTQSGLGAVPDPANTTLASANMPLTAVRVG